MSIRYDVCTNIKKTPSMQSIHTILFLIFMLSAQAQDFEVFALGKAMSNNRGLVISEQFMKINADEGNTDILAELGELHSLAKGTTALNHVTNELLIWGKETINSDYQMYVIDATSGKLSQKPIAFKQPPVDIHFDMRQHIFYGIRHSESKKNLEIISLDDNIASFVMDLPDIKSVSLGLTAFNSNSSLYIFAGTDKDYNERLYVIDIVNHQILSNSLIKDFYFYELQYDVQDSKLYALCRKKSNTKQFFFIEIIPSEARPVIISPMIDMTEIGLGCSTFEQKEGLYFCFGKDLDNKKTLYGIDVMTGDVVSKSHPEANITALECNNAAFLNTYFSGLPVKGEEEDIEPIKDTREEAAAIVKENTVKQDYQFNITPTYILDWVNIDVNIAEGESFTISIYDMTDQLIINEKLFKSENAEDNIVDLSALPSGIYVIKIKTSNSTYDQRVIKR